MVTGRRASAALARLLAAHGARYVGEMLRAPLEGYTEACVPGIGRARSFRASVARHDPLGEQLEAAEQCVASLVL